MALRNAEFIAVVRSDGSPIGTLSLRELRDRVATGSVPPGAPVEEAMNPEIPVIGSGMTLGAQALEMIRARTRFLLVTGDGGRLEGLLTESDLALYCGTNPCQLVREAWEIESAADLRRARERLNAFVASNLSAPEKMDWFVHLIAEFNLASLEQSIRIVGETKPAEAEISWLMLDSAARGELPTTMMPVLGAVYRRVTAGSHFEKQAGEVEGLLRASGLAGTGAGPRWVRTLAEWRKFFTALIEDPVSNEIYQNRGAFEFLAIPGSGELSRELRDHVMEEVRNGDPFLAVLANDVMARLPPLTFFKELVVDLDGARGTTLDLRRNALDPLADVARVFWMANGNTWLTGTIERLEWLGEAIPDLKERFVEAASAYRIVSYHRLRNANAEGNDGAILRPSMLSRYDQQLLKGAFRSITRLIEFTFDNFNSLRRL
jgi:CBS domain-containing protein